MRILLVEDDRHMAAALSAALSQHDIVVDHVRTLELAEEACRSKVHDAMLLDRKLPDGDGLSLIPIIRRYSSVPIIVLSALGSSEQRVAGLDQGADDYLPKPFSTDELLARLRAVMRPSGRTVSRSALEEAVYGYDDEIASNALDAHISRLRQKLSGAAVDIHGIRGLGYLLSASE